MENDEQSRTKKKRMPKGQTELDLYADGRRGRGGNTLDRKRRMEKRVGQVNKTRRKGGLERWTGQGVKGGWR